RSSGPLGVRLKCRNSTLASRSDGHPTTPAQGRISTTSKDATFDPKRTFPEVLNEPVFAGQARGWEALQLSALAAIRATLPASTVILTGADWSSVAGLMAATPAPDPDVIYTFHYYDPSELTSLAAYRPGLDRAALARLPFPEPDPVACERSAAPVADPATAGLIRFTCAQGWTADKVAARIGEAAAWGRRHDVRLIAGEFGALAQLNNAARLTWLSAVRTPCERKGVGWALWGYDDVMGFNLPRPPGARPSLDPAVLRTLGLTGATGSRRRP
ncbi:MAG: glycoside hydrolase family 5 protein, partial [Pseudomonadota bacterium]|nr:glycoside hydrolase family 5 protein [Pseudomonadota bacterium]